MKGQFGDRFDDWFGESLSKRLGKRFGESLREKTKYYTFWGGLTKFADDADADAGFYLYLKNHKHFPGCSEIDSIDALSPKDI